MPPGWTLISFDGINCSLNFRLIFAFSTPIWLGVIFWLYFHLPGFQSALDSCCLGEWFWLLVWGFNPLVHIICRTFGMFVVWNSFFKDNIFILQKLMFWVGSLPDGCPLVVLVQWYFELISRSCFINSAIFHYIDLLFYFLHLISCDFRLNGDLHTFGSFWNFELLKLWELFWAYEIWTFGAFMLSELLCFLSFWAFEAFVLSAVSCRLSTVGCQSFECQLSNWFLTSWFSLYIMFAVWLTLSLSDDVEQWSSVL